MEEIEKLNFSKNYLKNSFTAFPLKMLDPNHPNKENYLREELKIPTN